MVETTEKTETEKQKAKGTPSNAPKPPTPQTFGSLLLECLSLLKLGVLTKDARIIGRMLRRVSSLRQLFQPEVYCEVVRVLLVPTSPKRAELLLKNLEDVRPVSSPAKPKSPRSDDKQPTDSNEDVVMADASPASVWVSRLGSPREFDSSIGDVDLFLSTLAMMLLISNRLTERAIPLARSVVETLQQYPPSYKYDGRILGKATFYAFWIYELDGRASTLQGFLMEVYRMSVLHRQTVPQAIAINLLLRNFLQQKNYDQAVKFVEKAPYPEGLRSNAQHARYLYYLARINAVRLDYGEAYSKVIQAIRKAPQEGSPYGHGFRVASHKLCFLIQLLMGEIPERQLFNQKDIRKDLAPYAKVVQAVRSGGLTAFKRVVAELESIFIKDGNIDLVQRLHHNVVRAGLRKICASYSAISLSDIAMKLGLDCTDDTECIVSKAIADGVIDATIEFQTKTVYSKSRGEKRALDEPRKVFHGRVAFCLQLYNEALRAMQYPEAECESKIEEAEARRKEHQEQLARAEKDEFDGGDDGGF